ncbi:MAG: DEAD/DEAH box helicase, partial [Bacteroidia bacterium]|nr:DEAD/DEAH box helicase [Bacteroidia bacterium]
MSFPKNILQNFNIAELNPMQNAVMEAFQHTLDIQLISPTGSGKTLAYLLPLLDKLMSEKELGSDRKMLAMIIVPTRELALQIEQVFKQMGSAFKINCCYGGHSVRIEKNNLSELPAVLVGTPGRIAYHIRNENMQVNTCKYLVLDEFDKSLEAGFQDEMEYIIRKMPKIEKRVLCSATAIAKIPDFVSLKQVQTIDFTKGVQQPISGMKLSFVRVVGDDKLEALMLLLGSMKDKSVIVFCNHREAVDRISSQLQIQRLVHGFYHGGLDQIDREKTLIKLRNQSIHILVSTDLAARGLDIPEIDVVIHYQLPLKEDIMIHRNCRTSRMKAEG